MYIHIHTHTYTHALESQNSPTKICRLNWGTKEIKTYIYQLRTKLIKALTGKQS